MNEHKLPDHERKELEERVMRFRLMEGEVTDPLAARLLRDIITELETDLQQTAE
jgi:hypothetical protein